MNTPIKKKLYWLFEDIRTWVLFWKWKARKDCHGGIACCQYTDWPMDNLKPQKWDEDK